MDGAKNRRVLRFKVRLVVKGLTTAYVINFFEIHPSAAKLNSITATGHTGCMCCRSLGIVVDGREYGIVELYDGGL
ncbi:hypothetical protein Plhal710r2_c007g0032161 [Plasmopara halstedii]